MRVTKKQLKRIIREEKRKLGEGERYERDYEARRARRAAEEDLETALGQLLDAHIDSEWNDTESAYPNDALPGHGIVNNAGAKVMKFANNWWKQQKETEGMPREDWE